MNALIDRLAKEEILIVILALIGGIVAIVAIVSFTKWSLQMTSNALTLDREKLQAEMEIRNKIIDHGIANGASFDSLLTADKNIPKPVSNSDNLDTELATGFGKLEISPEEIEETLSCAILLEPTRKKSIIDVIDELTEEGASHESIVAAVRGLCASAHPTSKEAGIPVTTPAS